MKTLFRMFLLTFIFVSLSSAALPASKKTPQKSLLTVVNEFCAADAIGLRLSSVSWRRIKPYIAWKDEPVWDTTYVIDKYEIGKTSITGDKAAVSVKYHTIGLWTSDGKTEKMNSTDEVTLNLAKFKDGWKLTIKPDEFPPYPRVFQQTLAMIRRSMEESKSPDCSQLINWIFRDTGFTYPHITTHGNWEEHFFKVGDKPHKGDIIVWEGHVGLIDDPAKKTFIGAQNSTGVAVANYGNNSFWGNKKHSFYGFNKQE